MNPAVTVSTNATQVAAQLGELAAEQIPFALARTVNSLAFMARGPVQTELGQSLKTRNRYSASGIQVDKGTKQKPEAAVGIEEGRSYLIDHVLGGKRQGGEHGRAILELESLRGKSGKVTSRNRPGTLIDQIQASEPAEGQPRPRGRKGAKKPFLFHSSKWGNEVIARRIGTERYPLQILFAFKKGVSIKPEFDMIGEVTKTVRDHFDEIFGRELSRAIASAKSKGDRAFSTSAGNIVDGGR